MGSQTGAVIAKHIDSVIKHYKLEGKVCSVITDNGSNYVKAFKTCQSVIDCNIDDNIDNDVNDNIHQEQNVDDFECIEIGDLLCDMAGTSDIILPAHKRCSAHCFNLIATRDILPGVAHEDSDFQQFVNTITSKCQALFNKQSRSAKVADSIKSKIGRYFVTPVATRWNSNFDCLKLVLKMLKTKREQMQEIFNELQLATLTVEEEAFLEEYIKVSLLESIILIMFHLMAVKNKNLNSIQIGIPFHFRSWT